MTLETLCNDFGGSKRHAITLLHIKPMHTLGFELPANPALRVEVPLSITTGWLSNRELPGSPSVAASSALMVAVFWMK